MMVRKLQVICILFVAFIVSACGQKDQFVKEPTDSPPAQGEATGLATPTPTTVSAPEMSQQKEQPCYVIGDGVRVRHEPNTNAQILATKAFGDAVMRLEEMSDWSKVYYDGQKTGYIRSDYLSLEEPVPRTQAPPVSSDDSIISSAPQSLNEPKIIVKKNERKLELWEGETLFGSYCIGLGWEPLGHKKVEGDGKTPEGVYYVCIRNSASSFYLSLGVSYPNKNDAKAALDEGTIDQDTYDQIIEANNNKTRPPQTTAMGGQIMIHGMGGSRDWTTGCIAVDNDVMDILWKYCPNKTPIIIEP